MGQVLLELNVQIDFCSSQIFLREAVIFRYQSHREWLFPLSSFDCFMPKHVVEIWNLCLVCMRRWEISLN